MPDPQTDARLALYEELEEQLLDDPAVARGTMMGFPCLRVDGAFFASADHRSGHLVLKLPRDRVTALIDEGVGLPFAPAGRTFREWVAIPAPAPDAWLALLHEAKAFVADA